TGVQTCALPIFDEFAERFNLDRQQVWHIQYFRTFAEVLTDTFLLRIRVSHGVPQLADFFPNNPFGSCLIPAIVSTGVGKSLSHSAKRPVINSSPAQPEFQANNPV